MMKIESGSKYVFDNFKKGDKVRCIDASFRNLTEGDIYEVEGSEYTAANNDTFIKVRDHDGTIKEFWSSRFELVEEENKMTKQNKDFTGLKAGDMLTRRGVQIDWWTEGAKYEVFGDNTSFWITDDAGDKRWFTVEKDGTVSNYDVQRGFCRDKPEKKMYKEEDIYAGMKLKCVDNGLYSFWTKGNIYEVTKEVTGRLHIVNDDNAYRNIDDILAYLNGIGSMKLEVYEEERKEYTLDDLKEGMVLRCTDSKGYPFWTTGKEYTVYKDKKGLYITNDLGEKSRDWNLLHRLNGVGSNARMEIVSAPEPEESEEITLTITGSNYQELLDQATELKRLLNVHVTNSNSAQEALQTITETFGGAK